MSVVRKSLTTGMPLAFGAGAVWLLAERLMTLGPFGEVFAWALYMSGLWCLIFVFSSQAQRKPAIRIVSGWLCWSVFLFFSIRAAFPVIKEVQVIIPDPEAELLQPSQELRKQLKESERLNRLVEGLPHNTEILFRRIYIDGNTGWSTHLEGEKGDDYTISISRLRKSDDGGFLIATICVDGIMSSDRISISNRFPVIEGNQSNPVHTLEDTFFLFVEKVAYKGRTDAKYANLAIARVHLNDNVSGVGFLSTPRYQCDIGAFVSVAELKAKNASSITK